MDVEVRTNAASDASKPATKYPRFEIWFVLPLAIAAIALVLTYVGKFGALLSDDQSVWGAFGDYFGGVLNPLIGFITVILVLRTLQLTREESAENRLELARQWKELQNQTIEAMKQTKSAEQQLHDAAIKNELTDLQKCMEEVYGQLHLTLQQRVPVNMRMGLGHDGTMLVPGVSSNLNRADLTAPLVRSQIERALRHNEQIDYDWEEFEKLKNQWKTEFSVAAELLPEMASYFRAYIEMDNDSWVLTYYRNRIHNLALVLHILDLVPRSVFDVLTKERPRTVQQNFGRT